MEKKNLFDIITTCKECQCDVFGTPTCKVCGAEQKKSAE